MNSKNQNPIGRLPSAGLRHRFAAGLPAAWLAVLVLGMLGCSSWAATLQVPGDYETIQEAIAAAQAGDVIELSAGEYQESPIHVNKAVTIQGPNAGRKGSANDRAEEARIVNTKITITGNGAVLDGVEIYQTNDTAEAILVQAEATVKNSIIRRDGVDTGKNARGIVTASSTAGYSIVDNLFTGDGSGGLFGVHKTWQSGIYLNGGSGSVTGNTFEKCRSAINADDFSSASITISGNTFRLCGTYLSFGGTSPTEGSHTISGNDFGFDFDLGPGANPTLFNNSNVAANFRLNVIDNTFGGLPTNQLTDAQKFAIEARNFHRGRSERNGVVDFVANQQVVFPGTTIAGAIEAAAAGDSVLISPHIYEEDLSVSKKLTILGAKHGVAAGVGVALGDDRPTAEETVIDGGFLITASEVSIDGLTIRNGRSLAGAWAGIGIRNGADDVTVTNVIIESVSPSGSSGIETSYNSDRLTVTDSTIRNNWRGVYLNPGSGHVFLRNVIENNNGENNNGSGVGIGSDGQTDLTLTGNRFSGHNTEAIGSSNVGSNVVLRRNLFIGNETAVAQYSGDAIDAVQNYWGSPNGPSGATVGDVTAFGYYTNENLTDLVADIHNVTQDTVHETLQAAIDAAEPDDQINLSEGLHVINGKVLVTKKLHFRGAGMDKTRIVRSGSPAGDEDVVIEIDYTTFTGVIPAAGGVPKASGSSFWDLAIEGWEEDGNGAGYLMWAYATHELHLKKVAFLSNGNRGALYHDLGNDSLIEECEFKGSYRRWAYRGAGRRLIIRNNLFDVQSEDRGGVLILEYGRGTSGEIRENTFKHTLLGTAFNTSAESHITLYVINPLNPGTVDNPEDFKIVDNSFEFIGADTPNSSSNYAAPTAIQVQRSGQDLNTLATAPVSILGNIFSGYDYHGTAPGNYYVVATPPNSTVRDNVFSPRQKSMALLTGVADNALDARYNYWGHEYGPQTEDFAGNVTAAPYFKDASLQTAGPVHVAGANQQVGYLTIQEGINAAASGDVVSVDPGIYPENVVTTVPLTLQGSGIGTVIAPTDSVAVTLADGSDADHRSILKNLSISGSNGGVSGISAGSHTTLQNVHVDGLSSYGVTLRVGSDLIISDSDFTGNSVGMKIGSKINFSGISIQDSRFDNNYQGWYSDADKGTQPQLDDVTIVNTSFSGNGIKGFYTERLSNALFDNVTVSNNANNPSYDFGAGIDINLKWTNYSGILIKDSTFTNNGKGSLNGVALTVKARDDEPSYNAPAASLSGVQVLNSVFDDNERHFVSGEPGKSNAGPSGVVIYRSRFGTAAVKAIENHSGSTITAVRNYWGAPNPDFATLVNGNVDYTPWYADAALIIEVTSDNFTNQTIEEGETETYENLLISGGSTWTVEGGNLLVEEQFILDPGSTLNVIEGTVTFPDGSSFGGTFTFFNSFGSIHINGDLDIIASASGLILVSDVHVADEATITVNGNFTIDGSSVDSDGRFTLVVESGAQFTMARTVFSDGDIQVKSGSTEIYDNFISNAKIQAFEGASGARYFHNVVADSVTTQDLETHGVITEVDGWANVGTAENTQNNLPLGVELPQALLDDKRTMKDGVAYIQSGDEFLTTISVNKLQKEISGAEVLLGYNTQYFSAESIGLGTGWGNGGAPITQQDASLVIGRYNASLQLGFDPDNPMGTKADQTIADLGITAKPNVEGTTQVFYRVKANEDDLITGTRLTAGGPNPTFLTPFTTNTGAIVIDNTAPEIDTDLTGVSFTQDGHDLKETVTLQGTIQFEGFKAFDALAGIDDEDAVLTLVGPGGTYTASRVSAVTANPADPTVYGFTFPVTSATENGLYQVVFTVTDRSGNEASHSFGTIDINKNQLAVTVELEGAAAGTFSREVTFVFSAANGAVLETRNETLTFTNGVGSFTFPDVDGNTAYLSAKPQHHLRKRLEVSFDANGQGSVAFTGADLLHGGDLNDDNVVNMLDYAILRFYWLNEVSSVPDAVAADIDGDGSVNLTDYNILQARFYQQGIAQP